MRWKTVIDIQNAEWPEELTSNKKKIEKTTTVHCTFVYERICDRIEILRL